MTTPSQPDPKQASEHVLPRTGAAMPAPIAATTGTDLAEALLRSRESFLTLLDASSDLVVLHSVGSVGRVVRVNRTVAGVVGAASTEELVGRPWIELLHPEDRIVAERMMIPAGAGAQETVGLRWLRKGGGYGKTEARAARVDFLGEEAILVVARDVTERAEYQHQLLQRDRMAALGTLSAGVAHEINNPLTYLLVNLDHVTRRLRAANASDDAMAALVAPSGDGSGLGALVQSLQQATDGANRVRQIVRDLLTFAQGNVEQRGTADVRGIVESAVQMAWHEIRHRAKLVKNLGEVPPVEANEARLGQVFLNLLVNAAQAIPEGHADRHEIHVFTRTDPLGRAVVEVSDTGTGIAPEDMPRIFDPFFTTKGEGGTGLGLAISHGTIQALGGDIQVTSDPGRGSTFRVVLPAAKSWRASAGPSSTHDLGALARPRVLIIDDERLVGDAIARALADDSVVEVVTDAQQGLSLIAAGEPYDVILCDLMMPVMTGMDLYAEVVRTAPKIAGRIVFMTGGAFTGRARAFLESVVNPCLEKPLEMSKLRRLVMRAGRGD